MRGDSVEEEQTKTMLKSMANKMYNAFQKACPACKSTATVAHQFSGRKVRKRRCKACNKVFKQRFGERYVWDERRDKDEAGS